MNNTPVSDLITKEYENQLIEMASFGLLNGRFNPIVQSTAMDQCEILGLSDKVKEKQHAWVDGLIDSINDMISYIENDTID